MKDLKEVIKYDIENYFFGIEDKLKRRNLQIADLKARLKELKELLRDNGIEC